MNSVVFCFIRVTDILLKIWKVFKWICQLPLVALVIISIKFLFNLCLNILKKEEEQREDRKKKEKKANAVLKSSSRLLKELGKRFIEIER